jgi:5-methylcytosine-specific restriction enzyme A
MTFFENNAAFFVTVSLEAARREKEKASTLRKTQWWQRQVGKGICHYCGDSVPPRDLTMDHIVPIIRGGRSTRGNVVPACKSCNNRKKYLLPVEWEDYLKGVSTNNGAERQPTAREPEGNGHGSV